MIKKSLKEKLVRFENWVYPAQKKAVASIAKKQGTTQSVVIRFLIDKAITDSWYEPKETERKPK